MKHGIGKPQIRLNLIFVEDKHYNKWKPNFEAEIAHQKLSRVIDPNFNPSVLTCSYEKELWKDQQAYFWTVMLHVLQNPLGKACITDRMGDKDSRKAFLKHDDLQLLSPGKVYDTGQYMANLCNLSSSQNGLNS